MSSFLDRTDVKTAITDNTKMDLGHQHITTTNFMQLTPALCKEMVPGERCDVNMMTFARLQPLSVPTFGRANIKERAFFVPMRTIFRGWNDFITDTPHVYSAAKDGASVNYSQVPTISNNTLARFFLTTNVLLPGTNYVVATTITDPSEPWDICGYYQGATKYMRLTKEGKQCLKVLESLGYKIVYDERNEDVYSALPLLALAKIYCDWYFPSQYVNTGDYVAIMGLLNYDEATALNLSLGDLQSILGWITYVNFDSDYFVNAWDNPNSPSQGVYSSFKIVNIDSVSQVYGNSLLNYQENGYITNNFGAASASDRLGNADAPFITPIVGITTSSGQNNFTVTPVSEYLLHSLHALTDYMKRHQLAGSRAAERYLTRFGKKLSSESINRSNYIGSKMVPLQIGDVMSTSTIDYGGSTSSALGKFAGKGIAMEQNFSFDWSTNEFGYLIVLVSVVPAAGIYQGLNRQVCHIGKLDFWTPEFDNLGVQAISTRELYNNYTYTYLSNSNSAYMSFDKTVFGFAPRYGEYKYMNDQLTGDFVLQSVQPLETNASDSAWHLMRTFDDNDFKVSGTYDYGNLVHSRNFMSGIRDNRQFDRIFTYYDPVYGPDPITCIYDFQMVSFAPMKPLYETYDFEDAGKKVTMEAGGVKVN